MRRGGHVIGICGGYQMLGKTIADPMGLEGVSGTYQGLDLLDVETTMSPEKHLTHTSAIHLESNETVEGYEIHIGDTTGDDCSNAWLTIDGKPTGAASKSGKVKGCYLHGLFASDGFRTSFINSIAKVDSGLNYEASIDDTLDSLARHLETHLDLDAILEIAR